MSTRMGPETLSEIKEVIEKYRVRGYFKEGFLSFLRQ